MVVPCDASHVSAGGEIDKAIVLMEEKQEALQKLFHPSIQPSTCDLLLGA
jgi:hypothetical protein